MTCANKWRVDYGLFRRLLDLESEWLHLILYLVAVRFVDDWVLMRVLHSHRLDHCHRQVVFGLYR